MKRLIALLLVFFCPVFGAQPESIQHQTARLNKVLHKVEQQFQLTDLGIVLEVIRASDVPGVWGISGVGEDKQPYMGILSLEDYPASFSPKEARAYQELVVQHEALHFALHRMGVPSEFHEVIIRTFQADGALRKPW